MSKLHIKKGDIVYVNTGDDVGKTGRVLKVLVKERRALVEGINMVTKHAKPSAKNPQGGRVEKEAPIHISNLALNKTEPNPACDKKKDGTPSVKVLKIGRKRNSEGKLVRYVKKTGEEIE